jgi:hypothetical protein
MYLLYLMFEITVQILIRFKFMSKHFGVLFKQPKEKFSISALCKLLYVYELKINCPHNLKCRLLTSNKSVKIRQMIFGNKFSMEGRKQIRRAFISW